MGDRYGVEKEIIEMEQRIPENERSRPARPSSGSLIAGAILIGLGILALVGQFIDIGDTFATVLMYGFAAVFLAVFATNPRQRWWALIPAYVFGVIGTFLFVEPILRGEMDAIYWLIAIGAPFLLVFLSNPRRRWWALIPTYVMATTAFFLLVEGLLPGDLDGAYWLFAVAAPFLLVFLTDPGRRWWALIPGGILSAIGVALFVSNAELIVALALIVLGGFLLARQFLGGGRRAAVAAPPQAAAPKYGPEADKAPADFEPIGAREGQDSERM
jgi:hypothetical protein